MPLPSPPELLPVFCKMTASRCFSAPHFYECSLAKAGLCQRGGGRAGLCKKLWQSQQLENTLVSMKHRAVCVHVCMCTHMYCIRVCMCVRLHCVLYMPVQACACVCCICVCTAYVCARVCPCVYYVFVSVCMWVCMYCGFSVCIGYLCVCVYVHGWVCVSCV